MKTKTYTEYTVVNVPLHTPLSEIRAAALQQVPGNYNQKVNRVWTEGDHYCVQIAYTVTKVVK